MINSKRIIIPVIALLALATISVAPVSAAEGSVKYGPGRMLGHKKMSKEEMDKKLAEMKVKQAVIDQAIADNNYSAWVAAVGADSELAKKITSDKFAKFVEVHNLRKQLEAKMTELGLGAPEGGMMKLGWGEKPCNR